jgi:phosphate transport system permease protein
MSQTTTLNGETPPAPAAEPARAVRKYTADISAVGEPALWAFGGALALGIILVVGFLLMIAWNGVTTFWPKPIHVLTLTDGLQVAGEPTRDDLYRVGAEILERLPEAARAQIADNEGYPLKPGQLVISMD